MSTDDDFEDVFGQGEMNERVDPELLLGAIGLDDDEIQWRKDFIGFDDEDLERLRELEPLFRDHQEDIAEMFYDNLIEHDQTLRVFNRSPKMINELKKTQEAYLMTLATGDYDRDYFHNRVRIGKLHFMLDMPMKQYMGQYGVYYDLILNLMNETLQDQVVDAIEEWVDEEVEGGGSSGGGGLIGSVMGGGGGDDEEVVMDALEETVRENIDDGMGYILAVMKAINLDMQVASDAYIYSYKQQLEQTLDQQQANLADEINEQTDQEISDPGDVSEDISDILGDR